MEKESEERNSNFKFLAVCFANWKFEDSSCLKIPDVDIQKYCNQTSITSQQSIKRSEFAGLRNRPKTVKNSRNNFCCKILNFNFYFSSKFKILQKNYFLNFLFIFIEFI